MSSEQPKANDVPVKSMRSFGVFICLVAGVGAAYSYYRFGYSHLVIALTGASSIVLAVTLIAPNRLVRLYAGWMVLGTVLGKVVNPIVLGFIYFLLVTPYALISRAFGRDVLRLRSAKHKSYWVARAQIEPIDEFFRQPF
jgi:hypothetical protein